MVFREKSRKSPGFSLVGARASALEFVRAGRLGSLLSQEVKVQTSVWHAPGASRTPLRLRLSLLITALLTVMTLAGGIYIVRKARTDTQAEVRSTMNLAAHFIDARITLLHKRAASQEYPPGVFDLRDLEDIRHLRVTLYDAWGRVLDTNETASPRAASAPHWFGFLVGIGSPPVQSQVRIVPFDRTSVGRLVIAPDPSYETEEMWTTSRGLLALLLAFFGLVNGLVWWAVSRAMQPIERILQALNEVSRGNLQARLPHFWTSELSSVSIGFNHMAETLERSVADNRNLTRRLLETQENERTYIARELHDEIGQSVSAIHADAVAIRNRGGEAARESAQAIVEATGHIKEIVRSMLQRLRPPAIERLGLTSALRDLVASFQQRNPHVTCLLRSSGDLSNLRSEVAVAIYRVVQECLTNIACHAAASCTTIEVARLTEPIISDDHDRTGAGSTSVRVTVADDGVGFPAPVVGTGLGLIGMRERVAALGGTCGIDSRPGRGTRVSVEVPLSSALEASA
ncbi:MAG TPA: ATP-binding protein [Steroidobacteraceae bacterium]|nr:ATP-binding protein [Steroidobacteraceae bacterium]